MPPGRGNNFETYIGPVARMGMFLAFEPDAYVTFKAVPASEYDYRGFGGRGSVMVATLVRPQYPDQLIEGVVEIAGNRSNDYEAARTKAMGRALKLVGVPSQTDQLKLWAEVNVMMYGPPKAVAGLGQMLQTEIVGSVDEDEDDVEAHDEAVAAKAEVAEMMSNLAGPLRAQFSMKLRELDPPITNPMQPGARIEEVRDVYNSLMTPEAEPEEEPF